MTTTPTSFWHRFRGLLSPHPGMAKEPVATQELNNTAADTPQVMIFNCPHCKKPVEITAAWAGENVPCPYPECRREFFVPAHYFSPGITECWNCGEAIEVQAAMPMAQARCSRCNSPAVMPQVGLRNDAQATTPYRIFQRAIHSSSVEEKSKLLKSAIEICPTHQRSLKELGIILQDHCRDYAPAAEYLLRAYDHAIEGLGGSSLADFKGDMLDRAATYYSKIGRHNEAVALWERALSEGVWSSNAKHQIHQDIARARANAAGRIGPSKQYGPRGQGVGGISRGLTTGEQRMLAEASVRGAGQDELVRMVCSFGFNPEDASNLVADELQCIGQVKRKLRI